MAPFRGGPARSAARLRLHSAYSLLPPEPRQVPRQPNPRYPEKFPLNGKLQKERYTPFEERSIFKTWLFSAVRNTASKAKRRLLRSLRHLQEAPTELPAVRPVSVESIYRSQLRTLMQQSLSDLSQRQRQVLELVFYHDLTVEEAAGVMEVSVGSARTHYHRGKNRLKEEIEKSGLHHDDEVGRHQDRALI